MSDLYDIEVKTIDGQTQRLDAYRGRTMLIVNVASQCGLTPQYAALEELYRRYREKGLTILGFPCDQFAHQEPGNEAEIKEFCSRKYDVSFPMFAKICVNGEKAHPLYLYLKSVKSGLFGTEAIKWNFTKFLVDRDGAVVKRYAPTHRPKAIEKDLIPLLS